MMEWGDIGIKDPDDLRRVLEEDGTERRCMQDLHEAYGTRIDGMIAYLTDDLWRELVQEKGFALRQKNEVERLKKWLQAIVDCPFDVAKNRGVMAAKALAGDPFPEES